MRRKVFLRLNLIALVLGCTQVDIAFFATAHAQALEEVIVTARKREESLLDVPLSITALTADDIEGIGVVDTVSLSDFVPGFFMQNNNAGRNDRGNRTLIFRGLNVAGNSGVTAGGTMFVDGAPLLSGEIQGMTDVERVEILRGPQSVYFGRATFAGAINYITKSPGNEWAGKVNAEIARFGTTDVEMSVEGPVVKDKLSFRVSTRQYNRIGDYYNFGYGDDRLGNQQTESYGLSLYATPTENLQIRAVLNFFEHNDGAPADVKLKPFDGFHNCMPGAPNRRFICDFPDVGAIPPELISLNTEITPEVKRAFYDRLADAGSLFGDGALHNGTGLGRQGRQAMLNIDYQLPNGMSIGAISAYHRDERQLLTDLTGRDTRDRPNPAFDPNNNPTNVPAYIDWRFLVESFIEDWSQELRLSSADDQRLRWTVGANYVHAETEPSVVIGHIPTRGQQSVTQDWSYVDTYGIFAGVYYDFTPKIRGSFEARSQVDEREDIVYTSPTQTLNEDFNSFSPRVTIDYKPNDDTTLYAQFARGYRPGGFNRNVLLWSETELERINEQAIVQLGFEEEELDMFELGAKGRFLDGRAQGSVAIYTGTLKNQQINQLVTFLDDAGDIRLQGFTTNIGESELLGIELEGAFQVTDQLQLSGNFALNDTEIREYFCAPCQSNYTGSPDVRGNQLSQVPKTTGVFSALYEDALTANASGYARLDVIYRGPQYPTDANIVEVGEVVLANIRLGLRTETYTIEGYVTNLFDNDTIPSAQVGVDVITFEQNEFRSNLPDRRHYGIRASVNF